MKLLLDVVEIITFLTTALSALITFALGAKTKTNNTTPGDTKFLSPPYLLKHRYQIYGIGVTAWIVYIGIQSFLFGLPAELSHLSAAALPSNQTGTMGEVAATVTRVEYLLFSTATPTPTFTFTPTPTDTATPTPTDTATPTYTPTATATPVIPTATPVPPIATPVPLCFYKRDRPFYFEEPRNGQQFRIGETVEILIHLDPIVHDNRQYDTFKIFSKSFRNGTSTASWTEIFPLLSVDNASNDERDTAELIRQINDINRGISITLISEDRITVEYNWRPPLEGTYDLSAKLYSSDGQYTTDEYRDECAVTITVR